MSPVAVQTAAFSPSLITPKTTLRMWFRDHIVALNVVSLAIVGVLVFSYIIEVNTTISKGYQIRELETQVRELTLVNDKLELETRKSQSLDHVAKSVKMLGFVEAEMPNYVSSAEPSYAFAE